MELPHRLTPVTFKKNAKFFLCGPAAALVSLAAPHAASANGFYVPVQDPLAAARGNSFVATADRPSAVFYNPAGLSQIDSTEVHVGVYGIHLGIEAVPSVTGSRVENDAEFIPIPQLYLATPLRENLTLGLGLNSPFGLRTDWGTNTPFSAVTTETELNYVTAWAVLGYEVSETFSIGGGLGFTHADASLKRLAVPALGAASTFEFEGDDTALSWIASALWTPNECHSVGLTYRSKTDLDLRGSSGAPGIGLASDSASLDLVTPDTLSLGYAYRPNQKWVIETHIEWVNWDRLNTPVLRSGSSADVSIPFNWDSNFIYGIGTTYSPNERWSFSAGYIFIENSQPDLDFNPAVADADRHWLSAGVSYQKESWQVDLAYQYAFSNRSVSDATAAPDANDLVAGKYESRFNGLMLSLKKTF